MDELTGNSTTRYIGVASIAEYCGVNPTTVYQWLQRHGPDSMSTRPVPKPSVAIFQQERPTYGWATDQLGEFREWYANNKGWDTTEAAHHWIDVDAAIAKAAVARKE